MLYTHCNFQFFFIYLCYFCARALLRADTFRMIFTNVVRRSVDETGWVDILIHASMHAWHICIQTRWNGLSLCLQHWLPARGCTPAFYLPFATHCLLASSSFASLLPAVCHAPFSSFVFNPLHGSTWDRPSAWRAVEKLFSFLHLGEWDRNIGGGDSPCCALLFFIACMPFLPFPSPLSSSYCAFPILAHATSVPTLDNC